MKKILDTVFLHIVINILLHKLKFSKLYIRFQKDQNIQHSCYGRQHILHYLDNILMGKFQHKYLHKDSYGMDMLNNL